MHEGDDTMMRFTRMFLDSPYTEFYLREAARKSKVSVFAAKKYADLLVGRGILREEKRANLRFLKANLDNRAMRLTKTALEVEDIISSSLIKYLQENITALSSIVLFGSVAKGEDNTESDIDLVIIGKESKINLSTFEKKLGKKINCHVFSFIDWKKQSEK